MSKELPVATSHLKSQVQPLVSVLTPAYNSEKYLAECIESVLTQTYENWEYIIINNCSTDRTLEIAEEYAQKDSRIRIHDNSKCVSLMENHNVALRQMSPESKHCKIVHADDWLFPDCIERMVRVAESDPSVGMVAAYRLEGVEVHMDGLPYPSTVVSGREICRACLLDGLRVFGTPTSLLYRSSMVRQRERFFNESNPHFDTEVCYEILQDWNYGFVHQVLTFTRRHDESASSFQGRLNTDSFNWPFLVTKYGRSYLSSEEYDQRLRKAFADYYAMLGKSVLKLRGSEFWNYHREALANLGYSLSWVKLTKAVFWVFIDLLLNAEDTFQKALDRYRKKQQQA